MGVVSMLLVILITLKALGLITWSWLMVIGIPIALGLTFFLVGFISAFILYLMGAR